MNTAPSDAERRRVEAYYDRFLNQWDSERFDVRSQERMDLTRPMMASGGTLLVVGVGGGHEPRMFRQWGYRVTVLDVSPLGIEKAREMGFEGILANLETDDVPGRYDQITCLEVLEHLRDPEVALRKLRDALAPGGHLFIGLPNEFHVVRRLQVLVGRPDFARYDWPHLRFFTLGECRRLFADTGLAECDVRSAPLAPPRMKWLRGPGRVLCRLRPQLFAFSHIFKLRPAAADLPLETS
jgi:SAM-dependent methyltransferase